MPSRSSKRCECVWPAFIPAPTSGTGGFSAWVQAVAGNNTLTIEAEDFSPQANRRTATYRVQVNGTNRVPGYDLNGNLIDNGSGQTYEWDAENRLVKITCADQTSTEFRYDGKSRRVGITEKDAARVVTSEKRYLWAEGAQPAEERAADGRTVVKQYHAQGEFLPGAAAPLNKVFYTKDHLGSVRELVDGNGTLQTRYDYDLWGGRTKLTGTVESEVGYTGHHHHGKSGLVLTWYRAYDPVTGRWLSRDPIGEAGGINLYGYVGNDPIGLVDPLGLECAVQIGAWAPGSINIFGHAAAATSGQGVYSFGTTTKTASSFSDYLAKQAGYRDSMVYVLSTTPEQEKLINDYLRPLKDNLPAVPGKDSGDNCAARTNEALKKAGLDVGENGTPAELQRALEKMVNDGKALRFSVPRGSTPNNAWETFNPR